MKDHEDTDEKQRKERAPQKSPISKADRSQMYLPDFLINARSPIFSFIVFPFHHLISAAQLTSDEISFLSTREERRQHFWQLLAAQGIPASEAALLDDSLNQRFIERTTGAPVEIDWEVLYHHELQGCAELYRAELFTWKRLIYEAGDDLPPVVEFDARQIPKLPNIIMPADYGFRGKNRLFLDNLTAPFDLAFSTKILNTGRDIRQEANTKTRKKQQSALEYLSHFYAYGSKRAESWVAAGRSGTAALRLKNKGGTERRCEDDQIESHRTAGMTYHIWLAEYWNAWQRAARTSQFDFEFLKTIPEARSLCFYELTKLWRALSIDKESAVPPAKIEIEYEKFAALIPMPLINSERKIKEQVTQVIKSLKTGGYVKSFSLKGSSQDISWRRALLVFRFGD
ncbi:MAG TPA: hypothetical protein VGC97_15855 [Pyrinomonadaceae bacterium]|jgi:hypothetical protein